MKELEDYDWFPKILRQYQTDYIGSVVKWFNAYSPIIDYLNSQAFYAKTNWDLCSGSSEPALSIFKKQNKFDKLILSDKYPHNFTINTNRIEYLNESIDVLELNFKKENCYTMYNAFHHFNSREQVEIAKHVIDNESELIIAEILEPTILNYIKIFFATTLGILLLSPFIKPFSLKRLFFSYLLPINILTICYDGLVSVSKSKTVGEYQDIFSTLGNKVKIIKYKNLWSPVILIHIKAIN